MNYMIQFQLYDYEGLEVSLLCILKLCSDVMKFEYMVYKCIYMKRLLIYVNQHMHESKNETCNNNIAK